MKTYSPDCMYIENGLPEIGFPGAIGPTDTLIMYGCSWAVPKEYWTRMIPLLPLAILIDATLSGLKFTNAFD